MPPLSIPGSRDGAPETAASDLLDLPVFEFDRRRAAEDRHRDLEPGAALVDLLDDAVEGGEGAVGDADLLADLELDRRASDGRRPRPPGP